MSGRDREKARQMDYGWRNGDTSGSRQKDPKMGEQMDRHMDRLTDGCKDGQTKRNMESQTGRWRLNREQDRQTN